MKNICVVISFFFLIGCNHSKDIVILSRINYYGEKKLPRIRFEIGLINEAGQEEERYSARISRDGLLKFKVKQVGKYYVDLHMDFKYSHDFFFSGAGIYELNLQPDQPACIVDSQISEVIEFTFPESYAIVDSVDEVNFEWNDINSADYYTLSVWEAEPSSDKKILFSSCNVTSNKISFSNVFKENAQNKKYYVEAKAYKYYVPTTVATKISESDQILFYCNKVK